MKRPLLIGILLSCLLAISCQKGREEIDGIKKAPEDIGADTAAIRQLLAEFDADINAGKVDRLVARNYTDDAVRMPAGVPMLRGKGAILTWFTEGAERYTYALDDVAEKVDVENDFAYAFGSATGTITPKEEDDVFHVKSKWVAVYEKQEGGTWKVICDIFNNDGPDSLAEGDILEWKLAAAPRLTNPATVDEEAIKEWLDTYAANNNAGDFEDYKDFWTEDVILFPPGAPIIRGKKSALETVESTFAQYRISQTFIIEDIKTSGNIGYARISAEEKYTPKAGGEAIEISKKSVYIFQKQSDGTWRGSHCIWNHNR